MWKLSSSFRIEKCRLLDLSSEWEKKKKRGERKEKKKKSKIKVEFENAVRLNKSIGASVLLDRIPWGLKGVGKQEVYVGMRPLWSISR